MGLGAFPAAHPAWLGMLGMHGTFEANMAMNKCDVMLCVGARFDDRVTGRLDAFSPDSIKIHLDIDRRAIKQTLPANRSDERRVRKEASSTCRARWRALTRKK